MSHLRRVLVNRVIAPVPSGGGEVSAGVMDLPAWRRFALVAVVGALVLSFDFGSRLLLTNDDTR